MNLRTVFAERKAKIEQKIRDLSFERQGLQEQIEELDKTIWSLHGAAQELDQVLRDIETAAAVAAAKEEEVKGHA